MSERDAIEAVEEPVTVDRIAADLRDLGVDAGDTLLVHSALSELGWVAGGPQAVVDALQRVVTDSGTLIMPTHSAQYSDPSVWTSPPVPDDWVPQIEASMPPYRPAVTPTRGVGAVLECFRTYPGTRRSRHPVVSFAAWGTDAAAVVDDHSYGNELGEGSPLARLYERDASVLLLGADHGSNTSFHLAEYCADIDAARTTAGAPVLRDGERVRVEWEDIELDSDDFPEIGAAFEREVGATASGRVGAAEATLLDQRALVDFGEKWLEAHR